MQLATCILSYVPPSDKTQSRIMQDYALTKLIDISPNNVKKARCIVHPNLFANHSQFTKLFNREVNTGVAFCKIYCKYPLILFDVTFHFDQSQLQQLVC